MFETTLPDEGAQFLDVVFGVSDALDAIGTDDSSHGHRVAYLAYHIAQTAKYSRLTCDNAFVCGLIHDVGVSQSDERDRIRLEFDPQDMAQHCLKGARLVASCRSLRHLACPINYHHTPWSTLQSMALDQNQKDLAAIVFLADRIECLHSINQNEGYTNDTTSLVNRIGTQLTQHSPHLFHPDLVQAAFNWLSSNPDALLISRDQVRVFANSALSPNLVSRQLGLDEVINVAELLAKVIDAKSPFTFYHSRYVAELTRFLGKKLEFGIRDQKKLYLAGLVHDLGKLHTPTHILHKPNSLDQDEYITIQHHATDTRLALQALLMMPDVVSWAANHHERIDGSGYPNQLSGDQLDLPSRIVAVADVFQAMTQSRPYRAGLSLDKTLSCMLQMVNDVKLDKRVFECLSLHAEHCYALSVGMEDMEVSFAAGACTI